jgi:hypothetical protein
MDKPRVITRSIDRAGNWLLRLGGIASLAIGAAYIAIIALYASVGAPPVGGEAWLTYLAGKTAAWWAIIGISVLTNFLFVPVALSLYFALSHVNRIAMLIGLAFVGLFVTLELAVNWTSYASLVMLSKDYVAATNENQRVILIAAASYPSAVIASPLALVYAIGTLSFGFLVIGFVMMKGVFNKFTAYVGIATGILGIVAVAGVSIAVILNAVSATLWLFLVGYRLYRLAV